jgi:serine/threonine-protein kinase HipA
LVLKLNDKQIKTVYKKLEAWLPKAEELIDISFLNKKNKLLFIKTIKTNIKLF